MHRRSSLLVVASVLALAASACSLGAASQVPVAAIVGPADTAGSAGSVVSAMDAALRPTRALVVGAPGVPVPLCDSLAEPGWSRNDCGVVGGSTWMVQRRDDLGRTGAWEVFVAHRDPVTGTWVKELSFLDADASVVTEVTTMVADLTGDGVPELVLGLRGVGTAQPLGVEVVSFGGGGTAPSVLAHRDLSHGEVRLDGSVLVAQAAQYPNGEPSCCPAFWQETRISYDADRGAFVGTPSGRLPAPESGEF